jgi:propanol-preferring alcohol dehydrogenase
MRAIRIVEAGEPLQDRDLPRPEPGPDEVRIRVAAAGICHSDVHYRAGFPPLAVLPRTPGHEIAGTIEAVGFGIPESHLDERVCVHYQASCGSCDLCTSQREQFCAEGWMIGKDRDGGYAEAIVVPGRNAYSIPDAVSFEHAAVMMCSTATSYHALRRTRVRSAERVVIFGAGGLGMSAIQLAFLLGASQVYAVDLDHDRLALAESFGATAIGADEDPIAAVLGDGGADVALDLIGSADVMRTGLGTLRPGGRLGAVGLTPDTMHLAPYLELVAHEIEVIGVSDHLGSEIPELLAFCAAGDLSLESIVTGRVGLVAGHVNEVMDRIEQRRSGDVRTVIVPDPRLLPSGDL